MKEIVIIEFVLVFSLPMALSLPLLFVALRGMWKAFAGPDGKLNTSSEGWDLVAGIIALIGINFFYGSKLLELYYNLSDTSSGYTFWLTVVAVLGGAAKATPKMIQWIADKIADKYAKK